MNNLRFVLSVDMKLQHIPSAIVNVATKEILLIAFKRLQALVLDLPVEYRQRIEANPELYEFIEETCQEYYNGTTIVRVGASRGSRKS